MDKNINIFIKACFSVVLILLSTLYFLSSFNHIKTTCNEPIRMHGISSDQKLPNKTETALKSCFKRAIKLVFHVACLLWGDWLPHHYTCVTRFNTYRPSHNGKHFADSIFKCIFLNENVWILIQIVLKFVPMIPINKKSAMLQITTLSQRSNKPLPEPKLTRISNTI